MRSIEMSAKTIEEAIRAACEALGVDQNDENVHSEVLENPTRKFFRTIPAKVRVTVEEPEEETTAAAAPAAAPVSAAPVSAAPAAKTAAKTAPKAAENPAPAAESTAAAPAAEESRPVDIAADARLQAAVEYLTPIFTLLGAENFTFTASARGEATILHVQGDHLGCLIGRRGETMESLSYLASLVVNRMEGPYVKLGLDVGGYRDKRETDLAALAVRLAERVVRTGYSYEMEPMNPYERHIIHSALSGVEGVRSESRGEGPQRRVVIYSTDPNASNAPDRAGYRPNRGGYRGDRGPRRSYGERGGYRGGQRRSYGDGDRGGYRSDRGPRRSYGERGGYRGEHEDGYRPRGPRSSVPEREFANTPRDPSAQPTVPARTERIHDGDDFEFGKIEF